MQRAAAWAPGALRRAAAAAATAADGPASALPGTCPAARGSCGSDGGDGDAAPAAGQAGAASAAARGGPAPARPGALWARGPLLPRHAAAAGAAARRRALSTAAAAPDESDGAGGSRGGLGGAPLSAEALLAELAQEDSAVSHLGGAECRAAWAPAAARGRSGRQGAVVRGPRAGSCAPATLSWRPPLRAPSRPPLSPS
jgi:flagellar hook-length control protein FliK